MPSPTPPVRRVSSTISALRWHPPRAACPRPAAAPASAGPRRGRAMPRDSSRAGDAQAHPHPVAEREDRQIRSVAVGSGPTDGHARARIASRATVVAVGRADRGCDTARWARGRRTPHRRPRRGGAGVQHRRGIVGPRGRCDDHSGDVADRGDRVVVVEVPAEALLVAVARDPHDHGVAVLPIGEELQRRALAADLVRGVVQISEVLDLGDGKQPGDPCAEREPEDRLLVEQRVEHPRRTGPVEQSAGDAVHAAFARDVLAEDDRLRIAVEDVGSARLIADRHRHRRIGFAATRPMRPARRARRRPRRRGRAQAVAITACALSSCAASHDFVGQSPSPRRAWPRSGPAPPPASARPRHQQSSRCAASGLARSPRRSRRAADRTARSRTRHGAISRTVRRCRNAGRRRVRTQSAAAVRGVERRGQIASVGARSTRRPSRFR